MALFSITLEEVSHFAMSVVDRFIDWANAELGHYDRAMEYIRSRGVSQNQINRHRLGYVSGCYHADVSLDPDHVQESCSCDSCRLNKWSASYESGSMNVGARITNSVVLPLTSYSGVTVGFQIRSLDEHAYDSFMLARRPEGYFFGIAANLDYIWASKEVTLFEGSFDQLVFERLVSRNSLALTTSAMGAAQIRFLRRFVRIVNMCLDSDKAGRDGTRKTAHVLGGLHVRDVRFPTWKDPSKFWQQVGDDRFASHFKEEMRNLV